MGSSKVGVLVLWDATSGELVRRNLNAGVVDATFIQHGDAVLADTYPEAGLQVLDADTLEPRGDPIDIPAPESASFYPWVVTPDERRVVLVRERTKDAFVVDRAGRTVTPISLPVIPLLMAFSPDGERLAVVDGAGEWGCWPLTA